MRALAIHDPGRARSVASAVTSASREKARRSSRRA